MTLTRRLLPLALGALLLLPACKARMPHGTQEELGQSVFTALRQDDTTAVFRLIASQSDIEDAFGAKDLSAEERAKLQPEMDGILSDFRNMSAVAYLEIMRRSKEEGVDWKNAKFKSVSTEDCHSADTEICDIILHFTSAGKTWEVFIDNAGKATSGWILGFDTMTWMGEVL